MDLRLVTVALDPATGRFPENPLGAFDAEPLSVVEHFFHHAGLPHLLLVVHLRPRELGRTGSSATPRLRDSGPRAELAPDERDLFDRLRAFRNGRAEADGVPPFVVLTNRQLADVARRRPHTLAALREISGFGDAKTERYGAALLQLVLANPPVPAATKASPAPSQSSGDGA